MEYARTIHKSSSLETDFSGSRYFYGPHIQIFLSLVRLLRTSLLLWSSYTNLPLSRQTSQDLATSMVPIHKSSSPGTDFSRPRYFYGSHTQIFLSRDRLLSTSLLLWSPYTNLQLSRDRLLRTSLLLWSPYTNLQLSRDRLLRTSLLLWSPYTNLPLPGQTSQDLATSMVPIHKSSSPGQTSQDLATSMVPIHKSSSPGTGFSGPRYFYGPHTQIFLSRDRLLRISLLLWPPYTNLPLPGQASQDLATSMVPMDKSSAALSGLTFLTASHFCSPVWFPNFASQSGIGVLLLNLASHGWGSLD